MPCTTVDFTSELGVDFSCVDDLAPSLDLVDGRTNLAHGVARRLITQRGTLFYDRDYGTDVRRFLKASGFSATQIGTMVEQEALKEERVKNAFAAVEFDRQTELLSITLRLVDEDGPFTLVVDPANLTIEILNSDVVI